MKYLILIPFFFVFNCCFSQNQIANLVPCNDFEDHPRDQWNLNPGGDLESYQSEILKNDEKFAKFLQNQLPASCMPNETNWTCSPHSGNFCGYLLSYWQQDGGTGVQDRTKMSIQLETPVLPNTWYYMEFYVAKMEGSSKSPDFKIYLGKDGPNDLQRLKLIDISGFKVEGNGCWKKISFTFRQDKFDYNYLVIKCNTTQSECSYSGILVDDFLITPWCPLVFNCSPTGGELEATIANNPLKDDAPLIINNVSNSRFGMVTISSIPGDIVKQFSWCNSIGNTQPFIWRGDNQIGAEVANASYNVHVLMFNDCDFSDQNFTVIKNGFANIPTQQFNYCCNCPPRINPGCVPNYILSGINIDTIDHYFFPYDDPVSYKVEDTLHVSDLKFTGDVGLLLQSRKTILLNPGTTIGDGAKFTAEIVSTFLRMDEPSKESLINSDSIFEKRSYYFSPNPNDGKFLLGYTKGYLKTYQLLNISGQVIRTEDVPQAINMIEIDLNKYSPGIYLLKLETLDGFKFERVIFQ